MKKKALVTGMTGFAGSFLTEQLLKNPENEIYGTYLEDSHIEKFHLKNSVTLLKADLTNVLDVKRIISEVKPDQIYHLAAFTSPADSFKNPVETFVNNVSAEIHLLESVRTQVPIAQVLIISSSDIYGKVNSVDLPIDEDTPLMPTNPYAVSKIAQDYLGLQYHLSYGTSVVRVRPFNHIGPRQSPHFAIPAFARQIALIEKKRQEPILKVGNLTAKRDLTHVQDMVRAYELALEKGVSGEVYNIGFGKSYPMAEILDILLSYSTEKIITQEDDSLSRPIDNPELLCDTAKFKKATGWEPKISLEQALQETLDYWRNIV